MQLENKYLKLKGVCRTCLGCLKLEIPNFVGVTECKYSTQPKENKINFGKQVVIKE